MVQALRLNTMSKLTFADSSRFDALVRDVFPAVDFKDVEDETLKSALLAVYEEARLEIIPSQVPAYHCYFINIIYVYMCANNVIISNKQCKDLIAVNVYITQANLFTPIYMQFSLF